MTALILVNHDGWLYKSRKEILLALRAEGIDVYAALPLADYEEKLVEMGLSLVALPLERRSVNPLKDFRLLFRYLKILRQVRPDIVLSYSIKPNIYGGVACRFLDVPLLANITGLGSAFERGGALRWLVTILYRVALRRAQRVFFQNQENLDLFTRLKIARESATLLPGDGVNLIDFAPLDYPPDNGCVDFVFIGRVMREKGIDAYFKAAMTIRERHKNARFHVCGFCEEGYEERLKELSERGVIIFHGWVSDISQVLSMVHCTVLPSYHEGMSNIVLESAASARPVIATDIAGCREAVEDGKSGYLISRGDNIQKGETASIEASLVQAIERFLSLTWTDKRDMGLEGRRIVEERFDRQLVVDAYMREIVAAPPPPPSPPMPPPPTTP